MSDRSRTPPRRGIRGGVSARRKRLAWINYNLEQGVQWDDIPVAHSGGQQRLLYSPATWEPFDLPIHPFISVNFGSHSFGPKT
jgi:hypothetical protein